MEIKTFKDLLIWQKSMLLVTDVYNFTKLFSDDERFGLTNQLRRCAVSVPSNIVEGFGRNSSKEFIRFLQIVTGSLFELQTQIEIALNLKYIKPVTFDITYKKSREIERMISSFISNIKNNNH